MEKICGMCESFRLEVTCGAICKLTRFPSLLILQIFFVEVLMEERRLRRARIWKGTEHGVAGFRPDSVGVLDPLFVDTFLSERLKRRHLDAVSCNLGVCRGVQ